MASVLASSNLMTRRKLMLSSSQVPVYLAEIAPKRYRGRVVAIQQLSGVWGLQIYELTFRYFDHVFRELWLLVH